MLRDRWGMLTILDTICVLLALLLIFSIGIVLYSDRGSGNTNKNNNKNNNYNKCSRCNNRDYQVKVVTGKFVKGGECKCKAAKIWLKWKGQ
jgi:hypothetical protein